VFPRDLHKIAHTAKIAFSLRTGNVVFIVD